MNADTQKDGNDNVYKVPENIHTPPQKGMEIPGGGGLSKAPKCK